MVSFIMIWMGLEFVTQNEIRKRKTKILYSCIYMESRKMVQINLFAKQKQTHGCREQMYSHVEVAGGMNWKIEIDIYTYGYV